MPVQYENLAPISDFAGIILSSKPEMIPDNALSECNNFFLGQNGELIKRPVRISTPSNGTPPPATFYYEFIGQAIGFESNKVFFLADGALYNWDPFFGSSAYAAITTHGGGNPVTDSVQYLSKLYLTAQDGIYEWSTGTTTTKMAGSPSNAISIILKDNRLFAISGSRLYYSAAGNPNSWGGFVAIADGDGDVCTGLVTIGDRILVFKNNSIWVVYAQDDPANWSVRLVSPDVGCVGPKAVVNSKGLVYFINIDGVWITDGVALSRISDAVKPVFALTGRSRLLAANDTISVYDDYLLIKVNCNVYWESNNFTTLVYKYTGNLKGWTETKDLLGPIPVSGGSSTSQYKGTVQLIIPASNQNPPYYVVFAERSIKKLVDTVAEEGNAANITEVVQCVLMTKAYNFDQPTRYKRVKYVMLQLYAESPTITSGSVTSTRPSPAALKYTYITDNFQGDIIDLWQEGIFGVRSFKLRGSGYGRTHTFVFREESKATNLQVLGINFVYQLGRQQDRQNL